jgi:chemotaxis protein CheX
MIETSSTLPQITQPELVQAIRISTEEVFTTMMNLQLEAGEVFVEKEEPTPASGVVSIVGLVGSWLGSGSLSCSGQFACKVASAFLMAEYAAITEDVLDSVAEITNMIIGNVKTRLEERLGPMGLSTPTVIYGRNFQTRGARNQEWTVVPFALNGDRICVQVCLIPNPDSERHIGRGGFPIPHLPNFT